MSLFGSCIAACPACIRLILGQKAIVVRVFVIIDSRASVWNIKSINSRVHRQNRRCLLSIYYICTCNQKALIASGSTCEWSIILILWLNTIIHCWIKSICIRGIYGRVRTVASILSNSLIKQYCSALLMLCSFFVVTCTHWSINCK